MYSSEHLEPKFHCEVDALIVKGRSCVYTLAFVNRDTSYRIEKVGLY